MAERQAPPGHPEKAFLICKRLVMVNSTRSITSVLNSIVTPALLRILDETDIDAISLARRHISRGMPTEPPVAVIEYRLEAKVNGEDFLDTVYGDEVGNRMTDQAWIERLVSNLQDFVAESRFAWGELRQPRA